MVYNFLLASSQWKSFEVLLNFIQVETCKNKACIENKVLLLEHRRWNKQK